MVVRLALLICDTPVQPVLESHGDYHAIYLKHLKSALPDPSVEFTLDPYNVVETAPQFDPSDYDGIVITGSSASAYAPLPWIPPTAAFLAATIRDHPKVKIIGICFGHQLVSIACGGDCISNPRGWEVGVYDIELTPLGKDIFQSPSIRIQQMHRDHVQTLPPNFQLLGSTEASSVQGMALLYPNSEAPLILKQNVQVLAVQGHPEYDTEIVQKIVDVRGKAGIMNAATVEDGNKRAPREHDGIGIIGRAIWGVLGIGK